MNYTRTVCILLALIAIAYAVWLGTKKAIPVHQIENRVIEASCGQCQLGLSGTGCDLAVLIDGNAYYVDGSSIDDHGDAHADHGLCNAVRSAQAKGTVVDGRFIAESFEVLPGPGR